MKSISSDDISINDIITSVTNNYGVPSPMEIDREYISTYIELLGDEDFSNNDIEDICGIKSMLDISADTLIAIKTDETKTEKAQELLNLIKNEQQQKFKDYIDNQYNKAMDGIVFSSGEYTFLIIIGSPEEQDAKAIENIITEFFE
ncbi:MAG: DUF4358 domain-containing protein [Oscillospiraceae bacterium]